ncbi:hypothetical protein GGP41_001651 [Bipolaris sorokiniana]|uniref:Uncharacterized protein n=1 Tax=Cochliobolus sativus TaxID=45130 RepID=A0A8H6DYU8_COCSA|nr:hypothetical protein GGP41_001651 [Bipolaris sorokiniana]
MAMVLVRGAQRGLSLPAAAPYGKLPCVDLLWLVIRPYAGHHNQDDAGRSVVRLGRFGRLDCTSFILQHEVMGAETLRHQRLRIYTREWMHRVKILYRTVERCVILTKRGRTDDVHPGQK